MSNLFERGLVIRGANNTVTNKSVDEAVKVLESLANKLGRTPNITDSICALYAEGFSPANIARLLDRSQQQVNNTLTRKHLK